MRRATSSCSGGCLEFVTRTFTLQESNEDTVLVTELELILLDEEPEEYHSGVLGLKEWESPLDVFMSGRRYESPAV
ncbi:hypothetical protein AAC387_Pa09g0989 [Persea americana]